ncbi:sigma factor, partial [Streptomyces sp. NPDC005921]
VERANGEAIVREGVDWADDDAPARFLETYFDIVQEAIVRAWRHSDNPRCGQGSVRSRLLKVTRDLIIDRSRGALVRY